MCVCVEDVQYTGQEALGEQSISIRATEQHIWNQQACVSACERVRARASACVRVYEDIQSVRQQEDKTKQCLFVMLCSFSFCCSKNSHRLTPRPV